MQSVKSEVLSASDFFQLTVKTLLELCTHYVDGYQIVSIEGCLVLTLNSGDKVELNILQQDVNNSVLNSTENDDTNKSTSVSVKDMSPMLACDLALSTETVFTVEETDDLKCLEHIHTATLASVTGTESRSSGTNEASEHAPSNERRPSALMQKNGHDVCSICGQVMKTDEAMKRHLLTHTCQQSAEITGPTCLQSADATDNSKLAKIMRVAMQRRDKDGKFAKRKGIEWDNYPCKECESVFVSYSARASHIVNLHRKHPCHCGVVVDGRKKFCQHVRQEHPGLAVTLAKRSFVCEYCSRTFRTEALLNDHISTRHLGAVQHRCEQCDKLLGSAITLKIHQRQLHEHANLQTCDACGLQFTRRAGLIDHLTKAHPHLLSDEDRKRLAQLVCEECGVQFTRPTSLRRHTEARHSRGIRKYECPVCSRRFTCRRYVLRHCQSHHPSAGHSAVSAEDRGSVNDVLNQFSFDQ